MPSEVKIRYKGISSIDTIHNSTLSYLKDNNSNPGTAASIIAEDDGTLATLVQDSVSWLQKFRALKETAVILLLTPVVIRENQEPSDSDPFEPLGRSLEERRARIRHVPYYMRFACHLKTGWNLKAMLTISSDGLTSTHLGFIRHAHAIILCIQPPLQTLALVYNLLAVHERKPVIFIICSASTATQSTDFPTTILTKGHSPPALKAAASLIFSSPLPSPTAFVRANGQQLYDITLFEPARDLLAIHALWTESLPTPFFPHPQTLSSLLDRPGYSKHYIIRSPPHILGFCATYISYADRRREDLIASLAILLVHPSARGRGVGRMLHDHALRELRCTKRVVRFQLGSTFPRLLAGPLVEQARDVEEDEWFVRLGLGLDNRGIPGEERIVRDLILDIGDWEETPPGEGMKVEFRTAVEEDINGLLELVDCTVKGMEKQGWLDQYAGLWDANVEDAVVGVEGERIVAVALTYTPLSRSEIASNLP
jgi:GNAT superfamily N-acetyltransferase